MLTPCTRNGGTYRKPICPTRGGSLGSIQNLLRPRSRATGPHLSRIDGRESAVGVNLREVRRAHRSGRLLIAPLGFLFRLIVLAAAAGNGNIQTPPKFI